MLAAARPAPCGARLSRLHTAGLGSAARGFGAQRSGAGSPQLAAGRLRRTLVRRPAGGRRGASAAGKPEPTPRDIAQMFQQMREEQDTLLDSMYDVCAAVVPEKRRRPASGDSGAAGQPEATLLQNIVESLERMAERQSQMWEEQNHTLGELRQMWGAQKTQLGKMFKVCAAAMPENRRCHAYDTPAELAAACGLPHDAAAQRHLAEKLLAKHAAVHAFREHLMRAVQREHAKASKGAQDDRLTAVLPSWRSLPPPETAAEWAHEAQLLGPVAGALKPNFEVQQAVILLRKYCLAAAREEVEGRGPLLQLLEWLPPPGTLAWPPAMALALALAGKWPWELECDASLRLIRDEEGVLVVQEATLRAAGIRKAVRKLRQAFRLVAWLHSALGAALPRLEARIVVPPTKLRAAQRKLRGTSRTVQEPVPGEAGAKFTVSFKAYTVY